MFTSPINATTPEETEFYYIVWKEKKNDKHTITKVDKDGLEIRTGAVFAVEELWAKKNIKYIHESLLKLKRPDSFTAQTE